jgi:hypothetical protein
VRKLLVATMEETLRFWQTNVGQTKIVSEEPSDIVTAYIQMTAIYLGPKEGRNAEAKKMILRVNEVAMLVFKSFLMHNKKSTDLFMDGI